MADSKTSDLVALAGASLAVGDLWNITDISAGTSGSKSMTTAEAIIGLGLLGLQPLDPTLTALAALSATAGMLAQTGTDTFSKRTITGTALEILIANGDGASGNPIISLATLLTLTGKTITGGTFVSASLTTPALGTPTQGNLAACDSYPVTALAGTGSGITTFLATPTSANLAAAITNETGSGSLVFATSPTLVTPILGVAAATSINGNAITTGTGTINLATFTVVATSSGNLYVSGGTDVPVTDGGTGVSSFTAYSVVCGGTSAGGALQNVSGVGTLGQALLSNGAGALPSWQTIPGGGDALTSNGLSQFASTTSLQLKTVISDETGSGSLVFATSPTLVTPLLGTPTSGTLTNCTGLPLAGISDFAANVATFLATPTSANLAAAVTNETGSGSLVFATSPALVTPTLGVAVCTTINGLNIGTTTGTLTISNGKNLQCTGSVSFGVTDGSSVALGTGGTVAYVANKLSVFAATTSAELAGVISDETGSGPLVFATGAKLTGVSETLNAAGNVTGATNVDYSLGAVASMTLTGNATLTITNPPTTGTCGTISMFITGNGTATLAITNVVWNEAGAPAVIANTNVLAVTMVTLNGGTTWRASWSLYAS